MRSRRTKGRSRRSPAIPSAASSGSRSSTRTTRRVRRGQPRTFESMWPRSPASSALPCDSTCTLGVSTGEVMTGGSPGSQLRATGEPLTRAAQLAADAEPNDVLLDEATRRAVAARRDGRSLRVADGRPRTRAAASARRVRAGRGRPLVPALHDPRSRRSREVTARAGVPRRPRRPRARRARAMPAVRRRHHVLAGARGDQGRDRPGRHRHPRAGRRQAGSARSRTSRPRRRSPSTSSR